MAEVGRRAESNESKTTKRRVISGSELNASTNDQLKSEIRLLMNSSQHTSHKYCPYGHLYSHNARKKPHPLSRSKHHHSVTTRTPNDQTSIIDGVLSTKDLFVLSISLSWLEIQS
uniref:DNA-directed RNA polymerase n=1 Tax=Heterorhabditis bacteriophora TaxID=37862 RepID=A0A1I7XTI7_HETBA